MAHDSDIVRMYDPYRPLNWREQRILEAQRHDTRLKTYDDPAVKEGLRWLKLMAEAEPEKRDGLFLKQPALYAAARIRELAAARPGLESTIQAYLLSGDTYDAIAAKVGYRSPDVIKWYSLLYYDVGPFLTSPSWVTVHAILPALETQRVQLSAISRKKKKAEDGEDAALEPSRVLYPLLDGSIKFFAYNGGPAVADYAINMCATKTKPKSAEVQNWIDDVFKNVVRCRAAQAALQFDVNRYNVMGLMMLHGQLTAELAKLEGGGTPNDYVAIAHRVRSAVQWTVKTQETMDNPPGHRRTLANGVEFRDADILTGSASEVEREWAALAFREPNIPANDTTITNIKVNLDQ